MQAILAFDDGPDNRPRQNDDANPCSYDELDAGGKAFVCFANWLTAIERNDVRAMKAAMKKLRALGIGAVLLKPWRNGR